MVAATVALLAPVVVPAQAKAASPVLEFAGASPFPIEFTADGGAVTAVMAGVEPVVHCTDSHGEGEIIGPRSTLSRYVFTGCVATEGASTVNCQSDPIDTGVIESEMIEADLVYIDQAKKEVGMLLNPAGGVYMTFKCGGELVEARGAFLAPVDPLNTQTTSFTATLSRAGATQTPNEYENAVGERRKAIPTGEWEGHPLATSGVELSFAINTSVPLEIRAVTAAEIEAKQHAEEAAAAKRRQDEEAAAAAAAKRRQDEEAAAAAAVKLRQEEEARTAQFRRARLLSSGLARCRKAQSKPKRVRCEKRVKKKYASAVLR
ncbi:MAG TPA: hypothetical protein VN732_04750 [Solirubrobacterales bacterium]|nr:hypothetical protein [Solirubrobacterales bacterium]